MRINKIEIANFKPFKFPNIKKFEADIEDDIQVLIGQSGSSKSSVLNEITTFATLRSIFEKNGYKKVELEHNGDYYTLISDFKNKNKIHSFIKNGEELNIGGTQPVQQELVEKYFNFTPLVRDILYNNVLMCSLSKADRKSLLLKINPVDLSLVIDKHKYVCSKIREYKSNLSLLYRRKQEIESQMLSEDIVQEKIAKLERLKKELQELSTDEYVINNRLDLLKKHRSSLQVSSKEKDIFTKLQHGTNINLFEVLGLSSLEKDINIFSYKYPLLEKDNQDKYNQLKILLSTKNQEVVHHHKNIRQKLDEIDNANKHLLEINNSSNVNILENLLKELEKEYQEYKDIIEPKVRIEENEYKDYLTFRVSISEAITKFLELHITNKIISQELLLKCKNKISDIEYNYLREYTSKISRIDRELEQIHVTLDSFPKEPSEVLEQCSLCDYRRIYINQIASLNHKKEALLKDRVNYEKAIESYTRGLTKLKEFTYLQETLYVHVNSIANLLDYTNFRISKSSLISRLNDNPNKFLVTILGIIDIYPKIYKKRELEKKILEIRAQLEVMEKTNLPSIDFIKDIINKSNKEIALYNKELLVLEDEIKDIEYSCTGYTNYNELVNKCYTISAIINSTYNYVYTESSILYYATELQKLLVTKSEVSTKLANLEKELKEHELLRARYEQETINLINTIEEEKKILEEIEFGLSPSTGFPHKNMIEYLNVLINNVNCILESVWSYPMQLIPLTLDDSLDYSFKVKVDDVEISDISRLSRGQQTITNVAFTISFILNMGLTNYPIFFDEAIEGLDITHTQRALEWLKEIVDNKYVSQMFFVNHDAVMNSGFDSAGVICLMPDNISVPDHANKYVKIT